MYCPKSIVSTLSMHYLEQFRYWKESGGGSLWSVEAKAADAILAIEQVWRIERETPDGKE